MSIAEQKMELVKWIVTADDESIDRLVRFTKQLGNKDFIAEEEVRFYEKRSDDFIVSGEKGFSKDESLSQLRKQMK